MNELVVEKRAPVSPLDVLAEAVSQRAPIDTVERLVAMVEREREYQAHVAFDDALNICQKQIGRIAPNVQRKDTNSWWADYTQIDRVVRPIYTAQGFSIGYSEVEPLTQGKVRIKGTLSRSGVTRDYFSQITPSTTGPKGNAMATTTDADAIAASRAKRYILVDIFNIAIGIDKVEKEGIPPSSTDFMDEGVAADFKALIEGSGSLDELQANYFKARDAAKNDPVATSAFAELKNKMYRRLSRP